MTSFLHGMANSTAPTSQLVGMRSLREVAHGGTATPSVKENLSAGGLGDRELLGEVVETRYVIYAVLVHHAGQLGIYHLQPKRRGRKEIVGFLVFWLSL